MTTKEVQCFKYINNLDISLEKRREYLKQYSLEQLEFLYSEIIEYKNYKILLDKTKLAYDKYPEAKKLLLNEMDIRRIIDKEHLNSRHEVEIKLKEHELEEKNARYLVSKKVLDKKRAQAKHKKELDMIQARKEKLNKIQEILNNIDTPYWKLKKIGEVVMSK